MSSFHPKFKTADWHRLLLKLLGLQKIYNHFIVIEGINVLKIVSKKRPKNHKLNTFCKNSDKVVSIVIGKQLSRFVKLFEM